MSAAVRGKSCALHGSVPSPGMGGRTAAYSPRRLEGSSYAARQPRANVVECVETDRTYAVDGLITDFGAKWAAQRGEGGSIFYFERALSPGFRRKNSATNWPSNSVDAFPRDHYPRWAAPIDRMWKAFD